MKDKFLGTRVLRRWKGSGEGGGRALKGVRCPLCLDVSPFQLGDAFPYSGVAGLQPQHFLGLLEPQGEWQVVWSVRGVASPAFIQQSGFGEDEGEGKQQRAVGNELFLALPLSPLVKLHLFGYQFLHL